MTARSRITVLDKYLATINYARNFQIGVCRYAFDIDKDTHLPMQVRAR
jgi:hypothetical protein